MTVTDRSPLVSCIMPTRNRRAFVPAAIAAFQSQDYERRELVVVDDGADGVADLIPDDPRIRYERVTRRMLLGAKRNLACSLAAGDVIVHWDDDDWSASWRLTYQVTGLLRTRADICGLRQVIFFDPVAQRAWRYAYPANSGRAWVAGGTLCYGKDFWRAHAFPEVNSGEDTRFVWDGRPNIAALPDPTFYVATIHSGNTSPKRPGGDRWREYDSGKVMALLRGQGGVAAAGRALPATAPASGATAPLAGGSPVAPAPLGKRARKRPLRILAIVHMGAPLHGAGAEWYLQDVLRWLAEHGHESTVHVTRGRGEWELDGVRYAGAGTFASADAADADVLLTHLDVTGKAIQVARAARKPLVHLVHNDRQLAHWRVQPRDAALVVFNSRWIARAAGWIGPQVVVPPPVFASRYEGDREGGSISLLNLCELKGGPLLFELASMLPGRRFLAVKGAYGDQAIPRRVPPNVEVLANQPDVLRVYRRTRLLLMPSSYESWGRCSVEAGAAGIPVIAHPTPGLLESVGPSAVFCDRADAEQWVRAIEELDDPVEYERASRRGVRRAAELDPTPHLERLEAALREAAATFVPA